MESACARGTTTHIIGLTPTPLTTARCAFSTAGLQNETCTCAALQCSTATLCPRLCSFRLVESCHTCPVLKKNYESLNNNNGSVSLNYNENKYLLYFWVQPFSNTYPNLKHHANNGRRSIPFPRGRTRSFQQVLHTTPSRRPFLIVFCPKHVSGRY